MGSRSRVAAMVGPALAALALSACFDFDATMAGGPRDAGAAVLDATTSDGASSDAGGDSGDAVVALDDAGPLPTWDGGPFCASMQPASDAGIFVCDDFDEDTFPGSDWGSYGETNGTMLVTDASFRSPPNSVDERTNPLSDGGVIDVSVRVQKPAVSAPARLRFGLSVQPVQIDTAANAAIVVGAIDFIDATGNRYTVSLAINVSSGAPALALGEQSGFVDGGTLFDNHPLTNDPPNNPLTMNAWSDVVIEVDWTSAGSATGIVTVNGRQELVVGLSLTVVPTTLQVGIGTPYVSQPSPGWELRYDNVIFTAN